MVRKRILCLVLCLGLALGLVGAVTAAQVECDQVYCFSAEELSGEVLEGICVMDLPAADTGTVLLGTRVIRPGDILTAEQLERLTFQPLLTEEDREAVMTYLPVSSDRVGAESQMTISILGKTDKAPVAEDQAVETYKNLPSQGALKASDPEGQALTYTVVRQPRRGTVTISEDGTYLYTPKKNKVGTDSFTFTATDPAGKVSREATVTVEILKPTTNEQYADTQGLDCRFTAEWMKETGLFVGEQVAGVLCFQPEKTVSRGEFLTMLVKALELPVDQEAAAIGVDEDAPDWLKPYLAAALRTGISTAWSQGDSLRAQDPVTGAEAAMMVQTVLDLPVSAVTVGKENEGDLPAWAVTAMSAMAEHGIEVGTDTLDRAAAASLLYQASKLAEDAPGLAAFRA